ncbi:hypothetical protein EHS25_005685 [Saitozyma podzolica]|uniref:Uncharacterized protein n=1 Tax=Saitozyma podzolica TaxID=1890683 RepID=A0A427XVN7_9TREE|nr:hypothetical protein EHS25_005685 [Saitozyma podzolica]
MHGAFVSLMPLVPPRLGAPPNEAEDDDDFVTELRDGENEEGEDKDLGPGVGGNEVAVAYSEGTECFISVVDRQEKRLEYWPLDREVDGIAVEPSLELRVGEGLKSDDGEEEGYREHKLLAFEPDLSLVLLLRLAEEACHLVDVLLARQIPHRRR